MGAYLREDSATCDLDKYKLRRELKLILKRMQDHWRISHPSVAVLPQEYVAGLFMEMRGMKCAYDVVLKEGGNLIPETATKDEALFSYDWQAKLY